jgi:hypothetical protein
MTAFFAEENTMAILAAKKSSFPKTSQERYLTGLTALNIPSPEGTGDWHFSETFEGAAGRPPGPYQLAGDDLLNTRFLLGDAGIFDARSRLEPYRLELPPGPIYAADHYRAIADICLTAIVARQSFENSIILDDWLPEPDEQVRLWRLLETAKPALTVDQWERIDLWMSHYMM